MSDAAIREQIALLEEELLDLEEQVSAGDLERHQADALAERYRSELAELRGQVVADGTPAAAEESTDEAPARDVAAAGGSRRARRVSGRVLAGSALVGVAIIVIGWLAVSSLGEDTAAGPEGIVSDVIQGEGVDLSTISNEQMEQVVAENPDVIGMRLALARRYFNEGEFDKALGHYFEVLDRDQNPEALANVGWMTYLSGHPDIALGYLEASLQRNPDYLPAKWFISNVLVTLDRPDESAPFLVEVISTEDAPEEIRSRAVELLAQVQEGA